MDQKTRARIRQIEGAIREILVRRWDPLGVGQEPAAPDEYDGYIGGVYRLIASGASADEIAEHLADIERSQMGFERTSAERLLPVAAVLLKIDVAR